MATARSYLYVPGDQPRMLSRAADRGADALIVDLEDSVAPAAKAAARRHMADWLDSVGPDRDTPEIWVRVSAADQAGRPALTDLAVAVHPAVTGIVQPKCADPAQLVALASALDEAECAAGLRAGHLRVVPLIETAAGVQRMRDLAIAPRVTRLQLGETDLMAELGMEPDPDGMDLAPLRLDVVLTSAACRLDPPVGPAFLALTDAAALRRTCVALRRIGYAGRVAVHPAQVPVINEAFTPDSAAVARARRLVAAYEAASNRGAGAVADADGRMVDVAVVRSARRVLAQARRYSGVKEDENDV
jgi:citrate lyase subunit beta / citryl-CoA lyase